MFLHRIPIQRTATAMADVLETIFALDANNNNNENLDLNLQRNEKYSLRQRYKRAAAIDHTISDVYSTSRSSGVSSSTVKQRSQARPPKKGKPFLSVADLHPSNLLSSPLSPSSVTSSSSKSSFESIKPAKEKPKSKAPPLSKYRRKTANARERTRMREINSAFENLRKCVPMSMCLTNSSSHFDPLFLTTHQAPGSQVQVTTPVNEKLTKITTLKLAMKYIRMLTGVLNGSVQMRSSGSKCSNGLANATKKHASVDSGRKNSNCSDSFKTSLLSIKVPVRQQTQKKTARSSNLLMTTTTPRGGCKTMNASGLVAMVVNRPSKGAVIQSYNPFGSNGADLLFGSPCLTPPIDDSSSTSDLGMLLDGTSDEESVKFNGSCLSPPLSEQNIKVSFHSTPEDNTDLELGFFLESDSDTLQLSEPCLSPLSGGALDSFGDLLSSAFNEQTVLDMYL